MPPHVDRRDFLARSARLAAGLAAARALAPFPAGAAPVAAPPIVTRAQWGADERLRFPTEVPRFHPVRKFVVHHTVTPNGEGDPVARMRSIYLTHLHRRTEDGHPWQDIGYNFVIDEQGRVYEGRHAREYRPSEVHDGEDTLLRGVRGAHAGEWNGGSVGIALIGTYLTARPTAAALSALVDLIAWKCTRHGLDGDGVEPWTASDGRTRLLPTIVGHRDVRSTACPGNGAYALIPEIRRRVADRLASAGSPVGVTAAPPGRPGGYRIVHATGDVTRFGSASDLGDLPRRGVRARVAGAAPVPGADAFWIADEEGGVHGFGGAPFHGSLPGLRAAGALGGGVETVRIAAADARGYWLLDRLGGVFGFGSARYRGSVPALRAAGAAIGEADVVAIEPAASGTGYWLLDRLGGVFAFGTARYEGSVPALRQAGLIPVDVAVADIRAAPGGGYWVLDRRGGVYAFGGAPFHGSVPATGFLGATARRLAPTPGGGGYWILSEDGAVLAFGDAGFHGHGPHLAAVDLVPGATPTGTGGSGGDPGSASAVS